MRLAQNCQQRVMAGPSMFARVMSFERTFLLAVTLKHGRVQVQGVTVLARGQTLHQPFGHGLVEALDLAHAEGAKQIADGVVGGKPVHAQQCVQGAVATQ